MDAFNISFQSPVRQAQAGKSFKPKNDVQQTNEPSTFSKLFQSTSSESQEVNGEQQQAEILKKIEDTLKALQELPKDSLSSEELGTLAAMLQMLAQQTAEILDKQQGNQPFMSALQQIEKQLDELSALSTIVFDEPVQFVGVKEKNLFAHSEQELEQINSLLSQLELEQKTAGKQDVPLQEVEPFEKLIQQVNSLIKEVAQVTEQDQAQTQGQEQPNGTPLKIDTSFHLVGGQGTNEVQTAQGSQMVSKTETSTQPQTPTIRFNHLIEDISEAFRGSIRLNSSLEGTQLRVNITPENLGHLDIRLTSLDGKITAQIFTASLTTKEALDLQVQQLRNTLMQQGVSIDKIEIEHQSSQQSFGQQNAHPDQRFAQQQQKNGISGRNGNAYLLMEEEVTAERQQLSEGSVQVNYTI